MLHHLHLNPAETNCAWIGKTSQLAKANHALIENKELDTLVSQVEHTA